VPDSADRPSRRHGAEPDPPQEPRPPRRPPVRFNWIGVAVLGAAGVIAFVVTTQAFLPALAEIGAAAARDPANLPGSITVCDREWRKDPLDRALTRDEVFARTDTEPIEVSTGPLAACPPEVGADGQGADGMATVVYVRAGDDSFVPYELVGDP
jgi:hypothetical protein